jgi:hypothetical protein
MYLTYAEYQTMGGKLDEATFNDFEMEAQAIIDWYTFNRLQKDTEYPDAVKNCVYRLIREAQVQQSVLMAGEPVTTGGIDGTMAIASRSNDGVSVSYNVMSAKDLFGTLKSESEETVKRYLSGVVNQLGRKVLYRGIYPGE